MLVEEVLLAVEDQVGHVHLSYASRIGRGVVGQPPPVQDLTISMAGKGGTVGAEEVKAPGTLTLTWLLVHSWGISSQV